MVASALGGWEFTRTHNYEDTTPMGPSMPMWV